MLFAFLKGVEDRCFVLENFLRLCSALDHAASDPTSTLFRELESKGIAQLNTTEDRVFRHCSIMTQAYGLYEAFAESMMGAWLVRLPRYYAFADLPQAFQNAYRDGIARVVQSVQHRRYRHLSLPDVLAKYLAAVQGDKPWEFVNEALTRHDANLRKNEFVAMFGSVDLSDIWPLLETSKYIQKFKDDTGSDESLENLILDLVTYRNEASHGTPDEILGLDALRDWISFVRAFCLALAEVITYRIVSAEVENNPESVIGTVTEEFKNNIVVAICDRGSIKVGETIYFLRESDCVHAVIESLQLDDVVHSEVSIDHAGVEIGIKTSLRVRENARLVRLDNEAFGASMPVTSSIAESSGGLLKKASTVLARVKKWVFG